MFVARGLGVALILLRTPVALGFDPFSAMAVVGTAVSVVSTVTDTASDVAGATDALGELYSELDEEAEVSGSSRKLIEKLREIENTAREVGYTKDEITGLLSTDRDEVKSLVSVLRKLTSAVRTGKRVLRLLSKLEKKAAAAQIESVEIEKEQLRVQYRLLNELLSQRLSLKQAELDKKLEMKRQIETHLADARKRGAKTFGRSGVWSFPKTDRVFEKALEVAKRMQPIFFGLVLLAFFLRLIFYQFGLYGVASFGVLIRDVILFGLLLCAFPQLVHLIIGVSHSIAASIAGGKLEELIQPPPLSQLWSLNILWFCSLVKFAVFVITDFLFNFGLAFLVLLFPLVIFMSQMLGLRILLPVFFAMFLVLSLWPFFWNSVGILASDLWVMKSDGLSDDLKTLLFSLLQFVSPFVTLKILSGHGVGEAMASAATSVSRGFQAGGREGIGAAKGALGWERGNSGKLGYATSYITRNTVSRLQGAGAQAVASLRAPIPSQTPNFVRRAASRLGTTLKAGATGFAFNEKTPRLQVPTKRRVRDSFSPKRVR